MRGQWKRTNKHPEISLTARPLDAFEPKWDVYVIDEIREAVTTYGHDLGELAVNEVQFSTVEPKAAAVVTTIEIDISQTEKLYRRQIDFYAAGTFSCWPTRFVFLLRTKLDAPCNFEGKLIQLSGIEPKTAALLTSVVGQLSIPGSVQFLHEEFGALEHAAFHGHIIIDHLDLTVQALHTRSLLLSVLRR